MGVPSSCVMEMPQLEPPSGGSARMVSIWLASGPWSAGGLAGAWDFFLCVVVGLAVAPVAGEALEKKLAVELKFSVGAADIYSDARALDGAATVALRRRSEKRRWWDTLARSVTSRRYRYSRYVERGAAA